MTEATSTAFTLHLAALGPFDLVANMPSSNSVQEQNENNPCGVDGGGALTLPVCT